MDNRICEACERAPATHDLDDGGQPHLCLDCCADAIQANEQELMDVRDRVGAWLRSDDGHQAVEEISAAALL